MRLTGWLTGWLIGWLIDRHKDVHAGDWQLVRASLIDWLLTDRYNARNWDIVKTLDAVNTLELKATNACYKWPCGVLGNLKRLSVTYVQGSTLNKHKNIPVCQPGYTRLAAFICLASSLAARLLIARCGPCEDRCDLGHISNTLKLAAVTLELEKRAKQTRRREPRLHESYLAFM